MAFPKRKKKEVVEKPFWASSPDQLETHVPQKSGGKKRVSSIKSEVDGIKFDSQLEVYCYKALNAAGLVFEYGQHSYTLVEAFKCISDSYEGDKRKGPDMYVKSKSLQKISYKPDFIITGKFTYIIETKGMIANEAFPMRWKLFKKYLFDNKLNYDLFMPKNNKQVNQCIQIILNKELNG